MLLQLVDALCQPEVNGSAQLVQLNARYAMCVLQSR